MKTHFMKVLLITLLISAVFTAFQTPPTLTSTPVGSFDTSGDAYKISKRLLEVVDSSTSTASSPTTTYSYSYYNSSNSNKFNTASATATGTTNIVSATMDTLSCLVINDGSANYTLLNFNSVANTVTSIPNPTTSSTSTGLITSTNAATLAIK